MHVILSLGSFCQARNIQNPMPQQGNISQTLTPLPCKQIMYTQTQRDIYSPFRKRLHGALHSAYESLSFAT
jgi:hypothetical protein